MMDTAMAAAVLNGRLIGPSVFFNRVSTDTRTLAPGDLFVALKGERFDGHYFVGRAFELGAVAALVSDIDVDAGAKAGTRIAVDDSLSALGRLAAHWRRRFDVPVVVVVGSNGKTTVKEMIASILRAQFGDDRVLATRGNLNNAIGLPLTVLGLRDSHRAAVIELGMNHPGETAQLASIAGPTVALINNAQREHQEFMHGVADVAAEHGALLPALAGHGVAVINADDPHVDVWRRAVPAGCRIVDFALDHAAAVRGECSGDAASIRSHTSLHIITQGGAVDVTLAIPGRHSAANALAATAAALAAGAGLPAVVSGLETFAPVAGRLVSRMAKSGAAVIDDTYNANPDSVQAAIAVLAAMRPPRWLVLGDMGEVGHEGAAYHREAGHAARAAGIERLLAAGPLAAEAAAAFGTRGEHFASVEALAKHVAAAARENVTILVKGSRFMRMERVVAKLCNDPAEEAH